MNVLEPFLIDLDISPDHNSADVASEFKALSIFQTRLESFLRGDMDIESFNDFLESYGINPLEYWGIVEENVDAVIDRGEVIEDIHLILPGTPEWENSFYS